MTANSLKLYQKRGNQIKQLLRLGSKGEIAAEHLLQILHDKNIHTTTSHYFDMVEHFIHNDNNWDPELELLRALHWYRLAMTTVGNQEMYDDGTHSKEEKIKDEEKDEENENEIKNVIPSSSIPSDFKNKKTIPFTLPSVQFGKKVLFDMGTLHISQDFVKNWNDMNGTSKSKDNSKKNSKDSKDSKMCIIHLENYKRRGVAIIKVVDVILNIYEEWINEERGIPTVKLVFGSNKFADDVAKGAIKRFLRERFHPPIDVDLFREKDNGGVMILKKKHLWTWFKEKQAEDWSNGTE